MPALQGSAVMQEGGHRRRLPLSGRVWHIAALRAGVFAEGFMLRALRVVKEVPPVRHVHVPKGALRSAANLVPTARVRSCPVVADMDYTGDQERSGWRASDVAEIQRTVGDES